MIVLLGKINLRELNNMKCSFEIDYLRKNTIIEKQFHNFSVEKKTATTKIDRLVALWLIEKHRKQIVIIKPEYRVIRVNVPYFTDWVILQNDFLPQVGEYFLN